jgi:hypothetical protein
MLKISDERGPQLKSRSTFPQWLLIFFSKDDMLLRIAFLVSRSAFCDNALKLALKSANCFALSLSRVDSWLCAFCLNFSPKPLRVKGPSLGIHASFKAYFVPTVREIYGNIFTPLAIDFQAFAAQSGNDVAAIPDFALQCLAHNPGMDGLAGF